MSEQRIAALLRKAEPLRELDEEHPDKVALGPIVDEINALRNAPPAPPPEPDIDPEAEAARARSDAAPRKLGRPKKVV